MRSATERRAGALGLASWLVAPLLIAACGKTGNAGFGVLEAGGAAEADDAQTGDGSSVVPPGEDDGGPGLVLADAGAADGSARDGAANACSFGSAASIATSQNLNLFGQIVYYEDGGAFPAGHYRASYTDGCMKYDYLQDWTVQSEGADAASGFWFVGSSTTDLIVKPPGTVGIFAASGAYSTFDECVAANLAMDAPLDFDFDGGPIGVWLDDNPYLDNVAGDNGRNPAWTLIFLQTCPPNLGKPILQ